MKRIIICFPMAEQHFSTTPEERQKAQAFVQFWLGDSFHANFDLYPPSVGEKGDERVYGETIEIEGDVDNPVAYLTQNQADLALLSNKLGGEFQAIARILFNVKKKDDWTE